MFVSPLSGKTNPRGTVTPIYSHSAETQEKIEAVLQAPKSNVCHSWGHILVSSVTITNSSQISLQRSTHSTYCCILCSIHCYILKRCSLAGGQRFSTNTCRQSHHPQGQWYGIKMTSQELKSLLWWKVSGSDIDAPLVLCVTAQTSWMSALSVKIQELLISEHWTVCAQSTRND